ncbi:MAG: redoxin domain-containing protein [Chloroflexi bacterium]|nr:redoxin domain-containing protein [Chloroflexota bacterium]
MVSVSIKTRLRAKRPLLALIFIAAAALAVASCGGGSDSPDEGSLKGESLAGTVAAPEFPGGHTWFNVSEPLTLAALRGKVVVLDFWTLGCINCQHIVPDLVQLEEEFGDALVVIGVHSGKYDREHDDDSIREAVLRLGLSHAVVNDPEFVIWNSYGVNAWPTTVVIDPAGNVVGSRSGEGVYAAVQPVIVRLLDDFSDQIDLTPIPLDLEAEPIATAFLSHPGAVLVDEDGGRLFIADSGNNRILIADLDGRLDRAIGDGEQGLRDGFADEAQFNQPHGLELSADGQTLYVADTRNHALRAVDLASGAVTTLAGNGARAYVYPLSGSPAKDSELASPWGILLVGDTLYMGMAGTHQIWTMDLAAGTLSVFAGSGREGIDDGPRLAATLAQPSGLATDGTFLFWVDPESSAVRKLPLDGSGVVETLVGTGLFDFGDADGPPGVAQLEHPQGIAYANGLLYVADTYNHKIRTVDPETGDVATFAGSGVSGLTDGAAASAAFAEPGGIASATGSLYAADTNNHAVRIVDLASGDVSTLALTNLGVAIGTAQGRTIKVSLPAQEISPDADTVELRLSAPAGYKLNDLIESRLTLSTSNADAFSPSETDVTFQVSDHAVELQVGAKAASGQAILSATGEIYYCREGEEAVCLIDKVDLALPITVVAGGAAVAVIEYELPQ